MLPVVRLVVRWDVAIDAWVRARTTPMGRDVFRHVSDWGSPNTMAWLGVAGAVGLLVARRRVLLVAWIAAFVGAQLLPNVLKGVVRRGRPIEYVRLSSDRSFSFPSSHAMGSMVGLGMLAYILIHVWRPTRAYRWAIVAAAAVLIGLIGASRVYLGVHYASDVVGGYAAGAAWMALCVWVTGVALRRRER